MRNRYRIALALLLVAPPLWSQQTPREEPRTIAVNAVGSVQRQPDRAVILVAVESRAATAQEATQTNARKMDAVYAAVRKMGIVPPSVATISYDLQPQYNQPDPRGATEYIPRVIGYVAHNMVRVQVDSIARAGAVIDATVAAGANRIDNLSFELRDPAAARLDALKQAVLQARAMADVLAAAAGQRLGLPLQISSSYEYPRPMVQYRTMAAEAPAAATPIEAGSLTVTANVSITYKIEDH